MDAIRSRAIDQTCLHVAWIGCNGAAPHLLPHSHARVFSCLKNAETFHCIKACAIVFDGLKGVVPAWKAAKHLNDFRKFLRNPRGIKFLFLRES